MPDSTPTPRHEPAAALRVGAHVSGPDGFEGVIEEVAGGVARVRHAGGVLVIPTPLIGVRRGDAGDERRPDAGGAESQVIPVIAESIDVASSRRATGTVRVTKRVTESEAVVDEPVVRERVEIERRAVNRVVDAPPPVRQEGDTTIVPVVEEVLVVEKRLLLREEVHMRRVRDEAHEPQRFALRREHADVERIDATPTARAGADGPAPPLKMEHFMHRTIVAVFDSKEHAEQARQDLVALGIPEQQVNVRAGTTADIPHADAGRGPAFTSEGETSRRPGFFARLFGLDDDLDDDDQLSGGFDEAMRRGSCIVAVDRVPDDLIERASSILSQHGAIDMDERVAGWRERGWTGYDTQAPRLSDDEIGRERELDGARCNVRTGAEVDAERTRTANFTGTGEQAAEIPVIEEQLAVGKRVVQRGGVRVYTRVIEQPVEEQVTLHEERAHIERRPVDREATQAELGEAFREGTIEIVESEEQPVVSKTARVVEEVEVGRESRERTETVRDTVRRSQVEVEDLPASRTGQDQPESTRQRR